MSAPRATPGPWYFDIKELNVWATDEDGMDTECITSFDYLSFDMEVQANAHLIAAAPELYDALEQLHLKTVVGTDEERHAALNQAWAALTKARGEQS